MRKNSFSYNDEVDLSRLFNTIWKEKIKIILIIFVITSVSYYYKQANVKQDLFEISVNVRESKKDFSENFLFINNFLFDGKKTATAQDDIKNQVIDTHKTTLLLSLTNDFLSNE